ncbi:hypothetical protein OE88DRAFT_1668468 [Heliocybe sulcata]|uniref:F-box domain-containing protein n=1 Tax=Heliocybe sulcata TaxID=5364 RepID=A0A5C3ML54_9AGAM|nr:hypothetical protein OE88DRAFT_1668468 [Heliocybe sulcata]
MHPVLNQRDILAQVFGHLAHEVEHFGRFNPNLRNLRATLRSACLVCRSFQQPALDALWRVLDSLYPLFVLIPCSQLVDGVLTFARAIRESDLRAYRAYAVRVRKLSKSSAIGRLYPIHLIAYTRLHHALGGPLLPSLQELKWRGEDAEPLLSMLASPMLRHVRLSTPLAEHAASTQLASKLSVLRSWALECSLHDLACAARHLRSLKLSVSSLKGVSLKSIYSFSRLNFIDIEYHDHSEITPCSSSPVNYDDLVAFSALGELTRLLIDVCHTVMPGVAAPLRFPSLREIVICGPPSRIGTVLSLLRLTDLETIRVWLVPRDESSHHYESLFQSFAFPTLLDLAVQMNFESEGDNPVGMDARSLLSSLLGCRRLRSLVVHLLESGTPPVRMDDNDILSMAEAWPALYELCWHCIPDPTVIPAIRTLSAFGAHCPRLKKLAIRADPNIPLPAPDELPVSRFALSSLELPDSPEPRDAMETAQWVHTLFPFVQEVSGSGQKWSDIQKFLEVFQRMRSIHERQFRQLDSAHL